MILMAITEALKRLMQKLVVGYIVKKCWLPSDASLGYALGASDGFAGSASYCSIIKLKAILYAGTSFNCKYFFLIIVKF